MRKQVGRDTPNRCAASARVAFPIRTSRTILVAHLQQIAGVEEAVVGKHRIVDVFRRPVEGSGLLQALSLVGLRVFHDVIVEAVRFIY